MKMDAHVQKLGNEVWPFDFISKEKKQKVLKKLLVLSINKWILKKKDIGKKNLK